MERTYRISHFIEKSVYVQAESEPEALNAALDAPANWWNEVYAGPYHVDRTDRDPTDAISRRADK